MPSKAPRIQPSQLTQVQTKQASLDTRTTLLFWLASSSLEPKWKTYHSSPTCQLGLKDLQNTLKSRNSTRVVPYEAKRSCTTNRTQATGKTSKAEQTPSYAHKTANCKTHRVALSQDDAQFSNFYTLETLVSNHSFLSLLRAF